MVSGSWGAPKAEAEWASASSAGTSKKLDVVPLHVPELREEFAGEGVRRVVAQELGQGREGGRLRRQRVRLLVVDHLDAMLDPPQIAVRLDEGLGGGRRHVARRGERAQGLAGRDRAQAVVLAAPDQLVVLGEEFDLPDAAAPQLDVMAGCADVGVAVMGVNAPFHLVQVENGREVQVPSPHEGRDALQEGCPRLEVSGDGAGLDQRRTLPGLAARFVVVLRSLRGHHQRRGRRVRAQPEVDPESVSVAGQLGEERHERAREADEVTLDVAARPCGDAVGIKEEDEVDVRRVIQLPAAELAEAEGDDSRAALRVVGVRRLHDPPPRQPRELRAESDRRGRFGEPRDRARHLLELPRTGDVGEGDG